MDALAEAALPPGWAILPLQTLLNGRGESVDPSRFPDTEFVLYSVPAHESGRPQRLRGREIGSTKQRVAPGTVLLCKINPRINRVWRVEPAPDGAPLIASTEWIAFPESHAVDPEYLRLFLLREPVRQYLAAHASGVGGSLMRVNATVAGSLLLPLAPRAEQQRIVAAVHALFEEVDAAEAALARAREGLAQFRASLLHAACTGALTADWRAANPTNETGHDLLADVLAKRPIRWEQGYLAAAQARGRRLDGDAWKTRYPQPHRATTDDLEPLPKGWAWASLDQLCVTMTSGSRAWAPYYDRGTSVFVMAQNVRPGRFDRTFLQLVDPPADDPERIRTRIERDDLLVTIVGANTGDVCRVDVDVSDHYVCQSVALIRPVRADLAEYLDLFLNAERGGQAAFARMMYGAGRPHLSFDQLKSVAVPLPPSAEISAIVSAVREASIEARALPPEGFSSELRQSILHAAFTGRLVPQDPADEPAAALLAPLRAAPAPRRPRRAPGQPALTGLTP